MDKEEKQRMRKTNIRLFPLYKSIAWDYLFFYTIDFLFLTQAKGFSSSEVVLQTAFYSTFMILMQIPANIAVEFLGKKNSIILGNILCCFYMVILMISTTLSDLIFAQFISAIGFSIKEISEPSLLNESIAPSRYKSTIYSRINAKGMSRYYLFCAISKMIAGILFTINYYIPIICSLCVLIIAVILSLGFIEPIKKNKEINHELYKKQIKDVQKGFKYVLKSERLKALLLSASLIVALFTIVNSYYVSLLNDLKISPIIICFILAVGNLISSYASKKQYIIKNKFKNRTLMILSIVLSISTIISGIYGISAKKFIVLTVVIAIMEITYDFVKGVYYTIIDQYLRNFTNEKIDTKIFAVKNVFVGFMKGTACLFASFLLSKTTTANSMIIIGIMFLIIFYLTGKYMNQRVGLNPEEYSEEERKYDEQKGEVAIKK